MKIVTSVILTDKEPIKVEGYITKELNRILKAVCDTNEVGMDDAKGKKRNGELMNARREYCYWACKLTQSSKENPNGNSLEIIGAIIGKDHATVLHHKKTITHWLEVSGYRLKDKFKMIEDKLKL